MMNNPHLPGVSSPTTATKKSLPLWVVILSFILLFIFLGLLGMGLQKAYKGTISVGQIVTPFEVTTFDGVSYNTADLSGKVIVVIFWASWCQPCESEADELQEAWRYYETTSDVIFLGVDYADTEPEARSFLEKYEITYPNGPDLRSSISQYFHIIGVPETFIIDPNGKLAYLKIGPFSDADEIISAVDDVLKENRRE